MFNLKSNQCEKISFDSVWAAAMLPNIVLSAPRCVCQA